MTPSPHSPCDHPPTAGAREPAAPADAEGRRRARSAITQLFTEATSAAAVPGRVLQAVCRGLGWDVGVFWAVDASTGRLRCQETWHDADPGPGEFAAESARLTFGPAEGLPGRVWAAGRPEWVADFRADPRHPRAALADRLGLCGAFACPVTSGGRAVGVLEFFSRAFREPDADLLEMMATVGGQVGQFLERLRAEEAVRASEGRLRLALEAGRMGTWDWDLTTDQVVWSPTQEAIHGLAAGTFAGTAAASLAAVHPADRDPVRAAVARLLEAGEEYRAEYRALRPDAGVRWVEARGRLFRDAAGRPLRMTGIALDVTERKQGEEREARRAALAGLRADVAAAFARPGDLRAALQGCAEAVVARLGAAFARVWTLADAGDVLELQASAGLYTHLDGAHGRVPVGSFKIGLIAQERRPHLTNDVPNHPRVSDPDWARREGMIAFAGYPLEVEGRLVGVLALFARHALPPDVLDRLESVSEIVAHGIVRRRAEEDLRQLNATLERRVRERTAQLEEANRELEAFSYSVSHDLRAPLRHISGFVDQLRKRSAAALDDAGRRYLQIIADAARTAGTLVDELLAFSRMGRAELRRAPLDMDRLVEEVRREVESEAADRVVRWQVGPLPAAPGDLSMLRLVWRNLLSNALKYTRPRAEARVEISGGVEGAEAVYRVRDNGVGFDMAYREKLFGVFQRLHVAEQFEGTGIGLAHVRRIVQRHGGRTWAEGAVDRGAAFFFTLPTTPREGREPPGAPSPTPP